MAHLQQLLGKITPVLSGWQKHTADTGEPQGLELCRIPKLPGTKSQGLGLTETCTLKAELPLCQDSCREHRRGDTHQSHCILKCRGTLRRPIREGASRAAATEGGAGWQCSAETKCLVLLHHRLLTAAALPGQGKTADTQGMEGGRHSLPCGLGCFSWKVHYQKKNTGTSFN